MAKVVDTNSKEDGMFIPEAQMTAGEAFKTYLYDPSRGAILGRTGIEWVRVVLFYIVFYIVLAALFAISMYLFLLTISDEGPKWYTEDSIIGTSPGLGYRPMSNSNEESNLIWYNIAVDNNHKNWTEGLDAFLNEYKTKAIGSNAVDCNYNKGPGKGEVCKIDMNNWGPCVPSKRYDYSAGRPCVFIKLNKILKWVPEFYDDPNNLPSKMPSSLKNYIREKKKSAPETMKTVWVSCEGEHSADKENIGVIDFYPQRGFPGFYYPFEKVDNYVSPLIALHFKNLTRRYAGSCFEAIMIATLFWNVLQLSVVLWSCKFASQEANRTAMLVHKLINKVTDHHVKGEIVGAVTMYLVILIQFQVTFSNEDQNCSLQSAT